MFFWWGGYNSREVNGRARTVFIYVHGIYVETVQANLQLIPDRFSPSSGPASAMGYLERKLLRFQGLIWCINHF